MTTQAHLSGAAARKRTRAAPATPPQYSAKPSALTRVKRLFTPFTLTAEDLVITEADIATDLAYGRDD